MFAIRDFSVPSYANGFTLWHYKAGDDTPKQIIEDGYFNIACDMMAVGDCIIVSGTWGGMTLFVMHADAGIVRTAPPITI